MTDFRTPVWVHSTKKQWWSQLTNYILDQFSGELERLGLYEAVRGTCHGIEVSVPNFYIILELYSPSTRTFFTSVGELGLALHEMWEVPKLPMGHLPYKEYFPRPHELQQLRYQNTTLKETFLELMCYFHICLNIHYVRGNVNRLKSWKNYLFPYQDSTPEEIHALIPDPEIEARMAASGCYDVIFEEDDGVYEKGDFFKSYHHQARQPLSLPAILAGFLSV